MELNIGKFVRKPLPLIHAVQVTTENINEVAKWCHGEVRTEIRPVNTMNVVQFIKVMVYNSRSEKQTKAYVGDWVLQAGTGWKVYTDNAFKISFVPAEGVEKDAAVQAGKIQSPFLGS